VTVGQVFLDILRDPFEYLIRRWNWKSVIFSPGLRAIFLCVNLRAGWRAALSATLIELLYRTPTAGIYGALTQAFRTADPAWQVTCNKFLAPSWRSSSPVPSHCTKASVG
jgi:hypothetical protein